jgi:ABC-2 type transport system permease protein
MARVFVRLKLRLLRNGFSASPGTAVLYGLGTLLAVGGGVILAVVLASTVGGTEKAGTVLPLVVFAFIWLIWIVGPLLNSSQGDQSIDPSRLEILPLSHSAQVRGLWVAGLVGPAALGTFIGAVGAAFATGLSALARVGTVLCAVLLVLMCVAWSRALAAAFTGALNSRRGRDLTVALSGLIGIVIYFASQRLSTEMSNLSTTSSAGGYDLLAVLPPAALGRALAALKSGDWLLATGLMLWGAVGIGLALIVWRWALARRLDGGGAGGKTREAGRPIGASVLYPSWVPWLPRNPMGATAAKEMRYYLFRSTLQLQQLVLGTVFALLFAGRSLFDSDPGPMADYLGALVLFVVLFQSAPNVFGIDNASASTYLLTGVKMSEVLAGKLVALLLIGLPLGVVLQLVATAVHGHWSQLPLGLVAVPVPWLVWLGLGSQLSVRAAFPVAPGRRENSSAALVATFGGLLIGGVLVIALLAAAAAVSEAIGSPWAGLAAAWVLAALVGVLGLRNAAAVVDANPTALLAKLGGDRV